MLLQEAGDAGRGFDVRVIPQPEISMGDAAFRRDSSCLPHHCAEPTDGKTAQVNELVVAGESVHSCILAYLLKRRSGSSASPRGAEAGSRASPSTPLRNQREFQ